MSQAGAPRITADPPSEGTAAQVGHRASTSESLFAPLLGLIGLASAALTGALAGGSGFFLDDFWTLGEARDRGLTLHYLVLPVTGDHIHPGRRLVDWAVLSIGPEWWVAAAFMTLCLAATVVLAGIVVREISGSHWAGLLCAAMLGGSIAFLRSSVWWSSGVQEFPAAFLTLVMILAAVRYEKTRNAWLVFLSAASFFIALCFFDKYASMAAVACVLVLVARPPERSLSAADVWERAQTYWKLIAALVAVAALITVIWLLGVDGGHDPFGPKVRGASLGSWLGFLGSWWAHGVGGVMLNANSAIGGNLGLDPTPSIDNLSWVGLILLALLAASTIRGSRAAAIWVCALLIITLNAIVVGAGRLGQFDRAYLLDPRYQDLTVLTLILLVPAAWRASGKPWLRSGAGRVICVVGLACLAGVWVINGRQAINEWARLPRAAGAYATTFKSSLEAVDLANPDLTILDEAAPNTVVGPLAASPYNATGKLATLIAPDVNFSVNQPVGPAVRFQPDGTAQIVSPTHVTRLTLSKPSCGTASASADWHHAGAFTVTTANAKPANQTTTAILYTISFGNTNSKGQVAVFPAGDPYPIATLPLADYSRAMRVLVPARRANKADMGVIRVALWRGASACVTQVTAAQLH